MKPGKSDSLPNTSKIKVAHIASGDLWAGAEVQLCTLAAQLQQQTNVSLHICLLNYGRLHDNLSDAGIDVSVFNERELGTLSIGVKLYRALRQFKPDVIHTHRIKENILGSVVALSLGNTASIRTVHGAPEQQHGVLKVHKRLLYLIDFLCGRYLQKTIVAVSAELAEQLGKIYPTEKIRTIVNGVDREAIESNATAQTSAIQSSKKDTKLCFAGRLVPVKRLDIWLETAAILAKRSDAQFSFYIIGDGPERDSLIALASKLQLTDSVHFLGEQNNVPALLKQMDVLLMTSDHEGLPMVILEALCLKTLVIAHAVGGISALLGHGKAGYLVTRHIGEGYAKEIMRVTQDPQEANSKRENGLLQVNSTYAAKLCVEKYIAEYRELSQQANSHPLR